MYRSSTFSAAVLAGLTLVLAGCAGETPTEPKPVPTPSGGACGVTITLPAGPITASTSPSSSAIVYVPVPAQVTKNGQPVPDNSTVTFSIEAPGRFVENGTQTFVASTKNGVASAGPWAVNPGAAKLKASFECASATVEVDFLLCPDCAPFISNIDPNNGSTAGGEAVKITGGHFTDYPLSTVTFGGVPVSPDANPAPTNTTINVHTPPHAAGTVDVCATFFGGNFRSNCVPFTYRGGGGGACNTDSSIFISSISPNTGPASGGTSVTINGGGFPTTTGAASVSFGGFAAQVTQASATQITATTPQRALANPTVPETVDVTVTDIGSPTQRCARLSGSFTYTPAALDPTIYSISPVTGPNDNPTRVTIFGTGFQFPEQVFMTGGSCGTQKVEASVVSPITLTQIVFDTPRAVGAYSCLAGSQVDVQVLNPSTGKKATCTGCFKFYGCPAVSNVSPSVIPAGTGAMVTVTGTNFVSPVQATFTAGGVPAFQLNVVSVSATSVLIQMPPLSAITGNTGSCSSINGTITLQSTSLSCTAVSIPVSYHADTPTITSFSPTTATQAGGTSLTVLGTNFGSTMTAAVTKDGAVVGSPVVATVTNNGSLTFTTPFIPDSAFNRQNCTGGGTQAIPTTFGVRVTNTQSGCSAELSGLVISPTSTACVAVLAITTSSLPAATLCSPFSQTIAVTGGTPPYFFTSGGFPSWLSINSTTGVIAGTPNALVPPGPASGGPFTLTFSVNVSDNVLANTSRSYSLLVNDPDGPFSISVTGSSVVSFPTASGGSITLTALPNPTPAGFGPVGWVFEPPGAPAGFNLSAGTGQAVNVSVAPGTATGVYNFAIRASDTSCGSLAVHTATVNLQVTVTP